MFPCVSSAPEDMRAVELAAAEEESRPALFSAARERLTWVERVNIALIRRTFSFPPLDALMRWCQRFPGATWVEVCTRQLRHVRGLERLPELRALDRFILVANHRSYFDLFVCSMLLFKHGLRRRVMFPVRSGFFYDNLLGWIVNGAMSWFSMYPPIFRERKKLVLNHTAMSEMAWFLNNRKLGAGIHPEGTRNKGDDAYALLPAQSGVGRLIHRAHVPVIPVFINGLGNRLPQQILGNFTGSGAPITVVFGAPIDFGELLEAPGSARTYRRIADRTMEVIAALGEEERAFRAEVTGTPALPPASSSPPP